MTNPKLTRSIGKYDLTAIVINTIIGAGIFGLPAQVTGLIGTWSLLAFLACALIVGLIVLCFAEAASRFDVTGGSYLYAKMAFGSVVGFEVGWLYWVARVMTAAANTNLLVGYLSFFFPALGEGLPRVGVIAAAILMLTAINFLGVRQSAVFTNFFTVGKLVPLILFVAVGLFFVAPANLTFGAMPDAVAFNSAVLILIYAFVGFEAAVIPAGEIREPQRSLPFALLVALGVIAVLYLLIQIVCLGTLPELAASKRPLADAANVFFGAFGAAVIVAGAVISIFGNLNTGLLTASRLPFALAENGELPAVLARTHQRFKTPFVSLFLTSFVILILTIYSSFLTALTIATITRLLVYAATIAAMLAFRQRDDLPPPKFVAPFGEIAALIALGLIMWLLTNLKITELRDVAIAAAFGLVLFFAAQKIKTPS